MEEKNIQTTDTNSIKLIRGQRGNYGFEIKVIGEDKDMLKRIKKIDEELKKSFINDLNLTQEGN